MKLHGQLSGLILFILLSLSMSANSGIQFQYGNLELAKSLAGAEGKLYLVEFYANWCGPCKWMDQTTFSNQEVISAVNKDFVAVKIDIDDIDGFAWKQQYDVATLPTILVFNSNGKLLDRVEETMAPTKFLAVLGKHNIESNKKVIPMAENVSPKDVNLYEKSQKQNYYTPPYYSPQAGKSIYRLQMGTFTDYGKVVEFYNELKNEFIEPIIVLNDMDQGKTVYRLLMGEFKTEGEAQSYKLILQRDFNYDSLIH